MAKAHIAIKNGYPSNKILCVHKNYLSKTLYFSASHYQKIYNRIKNFKRDLFGIWTSLKIDFIFKNMIYLIGGTGRSGKSTVRKLLCQKHAISGISTDRIVQMFAVGMPDFGLNFESEEQVGFAKMHQLIKALLTYHSKTEDFVLEGSQISATQIKIYQEYSGNNVKMCVLGYAEADLNKKMLDIRNNPSYNEWTKKYSDKELKKLIKDLTRVGKRHKKECEKFGVQYFETSQNFVEMTRKAVDYLITSDELIN